MIVKEAPMLNYGTPGPMSQSRSELLAALMGQSPSPPSASNPASALPSPLELKRLYDYYKQKPPMGLGAKWAGVGSADNIPGTGYLGTAIGGTTYAQGAAPGPGQIEPM